MLVLSRKSNESIVIDGNITVEVLSVKGKHVRIGIKAPSDVRILRGELMSFEAAASKPAPVNVLNAGSRISLPLSA